jgi:hypothetical protein
MDADGRKQDFIVDIRNTSPQPQKRVWRSATALGRKSLFRCRARDGRYVVGRASCHDCFSVGREAGEAKIENDRDIPFYRALANESPEI